MIQDNLLWGSQTGWGGQYPASGSQATIQMGDLGDQGPKETGYYTATDNIALDQIHSWYSVSGGHDCKYLRCYGFIAQDNPMVQPTFGQGSGVRRQTDCPPGYLYNVTVKDCKWRIWWTTNEGAVTTTSSMIRWTTALPTSNYPGAPNVSIDGVTEQDIVGWDDGQTNDHAITAWDETGADGVAGHAGYNLLWRNLVMTPKHPDLPGVIVQGCSWDTETGHGTITYSNSAKTLTWAEYGDTAGAAVSLTAGENRVYYLYSGSSDSTFYEFTDGDAVKYVAVWVKYSDLPTSDQQIATYCCTSLKLGSVHRYAGIAGDFSIVPTPGEPPIGDVLPPDVPTGLAKDSSTESTITMSCDVTTDNGGGTVAGYRWYIDTVYDGYSATPSYTAEGLDADTTYDVQVSAYDNSNNECDPSSVVQMATSASTNIVRNPDFSTSPITGNYDTGWALGPNSSYDITDGILTLTNTTTQAASIRQRFIGLLTPETDYELVIRAKKVTSNGVAVMDVDQFAYSGFDIGKQDITSTDWTEYVKPFTTATLGNNGDDLYLCIWVNSQTTGYSIQIDYVYIRPA